MAESVHGRTLVGQRHALAQQKRNALDLVLFLRLVVRSAGQRFRQQGDFRRIDWPGTNAAAGPVAVLQAKLVAHDDAIGRLRLQRLLPRYKHQTRPRQTDGAARADADGQRQQQLRTNPRLERERALGLAAALLHGEVHRAPHRFRAERRLDHLGKRMGRSKHFDRRLDDGLLRFDGDACDGAGQTIDDVGPLLGFLERLAARFQTDVGWQLHPGLLSLHDRPRLEMHVGGLMRPAILEPGAIGEIPRSRRHPCEERRSRFVPRFKDQLVPFAAGVVGVDAHLALEMFGDSAADAEAQYALLARRPNLMRAALSMDSERGMGRSSSICRASSARTVSGQRRNRSAAVSTIGVSSWAVHFSRRASATPAKFVVAACSSACRVTAAIIAGDMPCVAAPRRLSCTAEMSRWPSAGIFSSTHSATCVSLNRRARIRSTKAAPINHSAICTPSRAAQSTRRIAVEVHDEIDQAGGGEHHAEHGETARDGPRQPQQALAPAQSLQLSQQGAWYHDINSGSRTSAAPIPP